MKNLYLLPTLLIFLCSTISAFSCDVIVDTSIDKIILSGLTPSDNTKLFDEDYNIVWECNSWSTACNSDEIISGLTSNTTYFLSVVSDICEEWIPIILESTATCNILVTNSSNAIQISGMNADVNSKLFDNDYNIVWECNPWSNNPCSGDMTIPNLANGNYYYTGVSDACQEWIPITIENQNNAQFCEVDLIGFGQRCFNSNEDGTFSSVLNDNNTYIETVYSESGQIISTNEIDFYDPEYTIENNMIVDPDAGVVTIDPDIIQTYTAEDNFLEYVTKAMDGTYYLIAAVVGPELTPPPVEFGESSKDIEVYVHHLDMNGNEIENVLLGTYNFPTMDVGLASDRISIIGIGIDPNGNFDVYLTTSILPHPTSFPAYRSYSLAVNSDFLNIEEVLLTFSNFSTESSYIKFYKNACGQYVSEIYYGTFTNASSQGWGQYKHWDYSVSPKKLLSSRNTSGFNRDLEYSNSNISSVLPNGTRLLFRSEFDYNISTPDLKELTIKNVDGNTLYLDENYSGSLGKVFQIGENSFAYQSGSQLYIYNCNNIAPFQASTEKTTPIKMETVFPNPAEQELFIRFSSQEDEENIAIHIYDAIGRLKMTYNFDTESGFNTKVLDISTLNAGVHHILMVDKNNNVRTDRFVKIRD